ncbi:MAG: cadmium-translocating P-type ATPase [Candidatus Micrarchaeota archaeon]|nr:cadmium-translocating P-type ATPase [Candidatus Micrarchaeota archaeon]
MKNELIRGFLSGLLLATGLFLEYILGEKLFSLVLFLLSTVISGKDIFASAFTKLPKIGMNFLVTVAVTGAFLIGHPEEGAAVTFLFFIAESLEAYASDRARRSIRDLLKLSPETATVKTPEGEKVVKVETIGVGDIVVVRPGEKIPVDGIVVKGFSSVDQSPITGESVPVSVKKGSRVFAGSMNIDGYIEIKTKKRRESTLLFRIIKAVEEARKKKSSAEIFVERFASVYTPAVVGVAILTGVVPPLLGFGTFTEWIYRSLVLLVVACPCALAISTPVSIVSGLTSAAKNGVLVKGGRYIETLSKSGVIVFDKTGTLTEGRPRVDKIVGPKRILEIAASLERKASHPVADALVEKARREGIKFKKVTGFRNLPGIGVEGRIRGTKYIVGSAAVFKKHGIRVPDVKYPGMIVFVGTTGKILGYILLSDTVRKEAKTAIEQLKKMGMKTALLTGDRKEVALSVSSELGIDHSFYELLPEDKIERLAALKRKYGTAVMVGDGINDAPALAAADVGIAVPGTDIAMEAGDVVLVGTDLKKIPYLVRLSKKTVSVVRENIFASVSIKLSVGLLALFGFAGLWVAVAIGDVGLTLAVVLNALRITRWSSRSN